MKNRLPILMLILAVLAASGSVSRSQTAVDAPDPVITLVGVGAVSTGLLARVTQYVVLNYGCSVKSLRQAKLVATTTEAAVPELAKLARTNDVCLVAWTLGVPADLERESVHTRERVAILDVESLQVKDNANGGEKYARRLEKETMRLVGKLIGLHDCGSRRCATMETDSEEALDAKGRNLCPPCRMRAFRLLARRGVKPKPWVPRSIEKK